MSKNEKISNSVIRRLPRYYRSLCDLLNEGITKISSRELAERMNVTASQIRQDLNCFGGFGQQGYGYNVAELRDEIAAILGTEKRRGAVLIGAGNLGKALARHLDYESYGCRLLGVFDIAPDVIGAQLGELTVRDMNGIEDFCRRENPVIAILCIPKEAAPEVCARLAALGIRAFWNFSYHDLTKEDTDGITVENVHLGDSLMALCFELDSQSE
ncbi:MAG: redox-sensing transcriptional repressor Rex [Ruminiclostridium sp.]|nr:redox-sensing transcriptional repressor Rex [Ruminiclostridium sp.]